MTPAGATRQNFIKISNAPRENMTEAHRRHSSRIVATLVAASVFCAPAPTMAAIACKPVLTFKRVTFSEPHNQLRQWKGILDVDASRCVATSGDFEIKFVRVTEMGTDLLLSERFSWSAGLTEVSLDFWWDEAVQDYWIGNVTACRCAD
jgi:hypothetical protein